jgi:hypothetical protein
VGTPEGIFAPPNSMVPSMWRPVPGATVLPLCGWQASQSPTRPDVACALCVSWLSLVLWWERTISVVFMAGLLLRWHSSQEALARQALPGSLCVWQP